MNEKDRIICADARQKAAAGVLQATETAHLTPSQRQRLVIAVADAAEQLTREALMEGK